MGRKCTEDWHIDRLDRQKARRSSKIEEAHAREAARQIRAQLLHTYQAPPEITDEFSSPNQDVSIEGINGTEPTMVVTIWHPTGKDERLTLDEDTEVEVHLRRDTDEEPRRYPTPLGRGKLRLVESTAHARQPGDTPSTKHFVIFRRDIGSRQHVPITDRHLIRPLTEKNWGPLSLEATTS